MQYMMRVYFVGFSFGVTFISFIHALSLGSALLGI
jgi:hypothetical protein